VLFSETVRQERIANRTVKWDVNDCANVDVTDFQRCACMSRSYKASKKNISNANTRHI